MLAVFISSFVFAGMLSAYIFLARGLVREGNAESLESRTRLALYYFNQDVSSATGVTNSGATQLVLSNSLGPVTYTEAGGILTRTTPAGSLVLLTGISTFSFGYFNLGGVAPSPTPSGVMWIKEINMSYTTEAGTAVSGAQSHYNVVSPQVVLKNKALLQ